MFAHNPVTDAEYYAGHMAATSGRAGVLTETLYFIPHRLVQKIFKYCDEYWRLDKEIKQLEEETRNQTHYNGKETRRFKRLERLREKQRRADYLRFTPAHMPKVLRDSFKEIFEKQG